MNPSFPISLYQIFYHYDLMPCCGKSLRFTTSDVTPRHRNIECLWCKTQFLFSHQERTLIKL